MTRVLVADDHLAVREGLRALLANEREVTIVGEADDGSTALALARSLRPDLIVLDDSMPGLGSLDVARKVLAELPDTVVVFLARDPGMRDLALAAGATAFVPKDAPSEELLRALRASSAAVTARQQFSALRPEGRRVVELLLGSRVMTGEQLQEALAKRSPGESLATTVVRLGLVGQPELADILARATDTPFVSLAPYPEISAPIDPTESRLSSPRLVDPVEREAARSVPLDIARGLGVVVTAADRGHGVVAMADPLDEAAFAEAERHSSLRLTRVTATADDIKDTLDRVWNGGGSREVIWTGNLLSKLYASVVLGVIVVAGIGGFGLLFRDALAPRFAFSLFALLCGFFFFLYALKYYVTIASVILITLFGDPAKFQGRHGNGNAHTNGNGHANGIQNGLKADGHTNGNGHVNGQHKEGYRTLRGEKLSEAGAVVVIDPWQKMGEIRLPADRQPFVSIHLALYNERRVVDRLLEACTSFDYENYEVIVADDSTDETVEKLKKWREHPRVRVIHRSSRKGFKGGALQEALRRMNPHTEYVMVFDADFVPPADAIWHFLDYFGRLTKPKNGNGNGDGHNGHPKNGNGAPQNGDRLAVVQGYQWHMLNASENWVTKGVRAEFSGSYVLERAGQELFGAMKMISGSVYMIRADVLRKLGWSTSITEDWELTIRLYLAGYKVLYTPYIQAPAECVSTIRRLIKQRMRWAEGHTFNIKKYFLAILRSPHLTWQEKLEFLYYAPYYLQSVLFTLGTLAWILGVFVLGQKLPMWAEIFGWTLVLSNALALPLMNLAGVLLEGSLRRDALGLLSFIGLSWILVPFQAYAALKGLFEREEGGWVRTPKSGRVTETLERFRLARLLPWELPKRRLPQQKRRSRLGQAALTCFALALAMGILTVGALSIRALANSGASSEADFAVPALLGTAIPLVVLALGWLRLKRRFTAAILAFCVGLSVNVVFLASAIPAAAVMDYGSNVFTFRNTTTFNSPNLDMVQSYTPSGAGTTTPAAAGNNWTASFASDTALDAYSMAAGTATTDLYLQNTAASGIVVGNVTSTGVDANSIAITTPAGVASGDVMIVQLSFEKGSDITLTDPTCACWTLVRRTNNLTDVGLAVYRRVAGASEPASYTWNFSTSAKIAGANLSFGGVDTTVNGGVDVENGQATTSGTSHSTPSVTTTVANTMLVAAFGIKAGTSWTQSTGMDERYDVAAGGGITMTGATEVKAAAGATTETASSGTSAVGVTHILALKPSSATKSCTLTTNLKHVPAIMLRGATSASVAAGVTTLTLSTPAGTVQNDVLIAAIGIRPNTATITAPGGWTLVRRVDQTLATGNSLAVYRRVATSSEPASHAFTLAAAHTGAAGGIEAYAGVDTTTPVNVENGAATAVSLSHATPSVTTTVANTMVVTHHTFASAATWTPPAGMTEALDVSLADPADGGSGQSLIGSYVAQAAAAATGTKTATASQCCSNTGYRDSVMFDAPQAYWRLGDSSGTTADSSGNGRDGTYAGGPTLGQAGALANNTVDTAVLFDGSDDRAEVAYVAALNPAQFSIEAWVYFTGGAGTYRSPITSRDAYVGYTSGYILYATDTNVWQFWLGNGTGWTTLAGPAVTLNAWTHLVATYDGANARIYVNGALAAGPLVSGYLANAAASCRGIAGPGCPLRIGAGNTEWPTPDFFFPGRIDEVAVYNVALSAARITDHYNDADGRDPGATHILALRPKAATTIGSGTATIDNTGSTTLRTNTFSTSAVDFNTGDRLQFELIAPNDPIRCLVRLHFDGTGIASKLTTATIVPEGILGLLLLAPALPLLIRRWKARRQVRM